MFLHIAHNYPYQICIKTNLAIMPFGIFFLFIQIGFVFQFDKFITTVNRNLVDSNMFIRSLVLSLEHFQNEEEIAKG